MTIYNVKSVLVTERFNGCTTAVKITAKFHNYTANVNQNRKTGKNDFLPYGVHTHRTAKIVWSKPFAFLAFEHPSLTCWSTKPLVRHGRAFKDVFGEWWHLHGPHPLFKLQNLCSHVWISKTAKCYTKLKNLIRFGYRLRILQLLQDTDIVFRRLFENLVSKVLANFFQRIWYQPTPVKPKLSQRSE